MKNDELLEAEVAQTERIGLGDLVIVVLIAAITLFFAGLWEYPGLHPSLWDGVAVATGVRPATSVLPGYWTAAASQIYAWFGLAHGAAMMRLFGHVALAAVAVCVYAVLREWLALAMRMRPQMSKRRTLVMRMASAVGAAAFVASDPVWTAGQCLSETTILLGLTLGAIEFFFVFLRKGTLKYAYLCALMLGLLSAETPMGIILSLILIFLNNAILKYMPALESPFFKPSVMEVGKWHMTFIFLSALAGGVALNSWTFIAHDGLVGTGGTVGDIPLSYLLSYWHRLAGAADASAWVLWIGVSILPFVVATIKFPESADEERFLSYTSGLIFFGCGVVVLAQSASLPALWIWTYSPMKSQFLLSIGLFCCAATLALSLTILGVDALCRDHKRLAEQFFGEIVDDEEDDDEENGNRPIRPLARRIEKDVRVPLSTVVLRRLGIIVIPLVVVAVMIPGRVKKTTRQMMTILNAAIEEIVREAGDAKFLFSDGNLDAAIELAAVRNGLPLKCYSLMGGPGAYNVYLRSREMTDEEDRFSFKYDTAMGLRSWIRDKPARLAESAALMGFDLWKRDGKPIPPMGGLLSRLTGFVDEAERQRGIAAAQDLAQQVLAVHHGKGGTKTCTDKAILDAFYALQWRLARMCIYRGEAEDLAGEAEAAITDANLSKRLNECNAIYKDLVRAMEKRNEAMMQKLTPREGLQLALVRADFTMGKLYAETILGSDPDNPDANFAMGMFYLKERQLSRAERYLLRCLIRKPEEPAVYNNLAMLQIELKKFDAARVNVEKALKLIPDSAAVLDTKKALDAAIEAAKNPPKKKPLVDKQ